MKRITGMLRKGAGACGGGRRAAGSCGQEFIDEVVVAREMSEVARKAAASKIVRAIDIEVMHKQT